MKKHATLAITVVLMAGLTTAFWDWNEFDLNQKGQAAVIDMEGQIMPSSSGFDSGTITPERVSDLNQDAKAQGADAIIYEWNSGGGAIVASKEVKDEISSTEIPTVCRFRDVAASGAYLASLGCDHIVADSVSMTGSIGVTGSYFEFTELMDEYGINYVNVTAGEYKEAGSPFQNSSEEEMRVIENLVDDVHDEFLGTVESERNVTQEDMEDISTGRVILGFEAEEKNMVDSLGGQRTAIEQAENLTGKELETFKVDEEEPFNFLELLLIDSEFSEIFQETPYPMLAQL